MQRTFEREGLEVAAFIDAQDDNIEPPTIADGIRDAMVSLGIRPRRQPALGDAVLAALRQSLYQSSTDERVYFGRLSRTYSLLFTLRTEPRLVRYFQEMAADFNLYVGADILVRALSERFVATEDQMTRNLLHLTREAGATLVLAEPVLEEVVNHLRVCDAEFRNFFAGMEERVTDDMARTIPKILLRAYFYAKLNSDLGSASPKSWASYVNQFCTYGELYRARAFEEVRMYLQAEFGMTFEARSLLEGLVSDEQVRELTERLAPRKAREELARNDALLALAVYGRREQLNEESTVSEFGLRTWWFTGETSIVRHTRDLVSGHGGTRYMMRPEFLLNFFALAPSLQEIRTAYSNVFPSLLGVRLARRMDEGAFHKLLENVREADNLDEGRKLAVISQLSDKLKADFTRQYVQEFAADA